MANRFPLIANATDSKVYELASGDNLDLTGSGIANSTAVITLPTVTGTLATLAGTETLTNKTINLTSNTLVATSAQIASAVTDETGSGSLVFGTSPTFTTSVLTGSTSLAVFNTTATTITAYGAATSITVGNATAATYTLNPGTLVGANTTQNVFNTVATTVNAFGAATTLSLGAGTGTTTINNNTVITGNLTVNGTTTTVNSTTLTVDDILIELGSVTTPTDTTANGGGIKLYGTTNKTILWDSTNSNWTSSEFFNLASGKTFKINNVPVLTSSAVLNDSSQTSITIGGSATTISIGAATGKSTFNSTDDSTSLTTGSLITAGGLAVTKAANIGTKLYVGSGAYTTSTTMNNPAAVIKAAGSNYVQLSLVNSTSTGSSDFIAYGDNYPGYATADKGWVDVGFTGSGFNDTSYTITGKNDGYVFASAVSGTGLSGNLVFATDSTGTTNDLIFGTGGFLAANEKMRFIHATGQFYIETTTASSSTSTGALRVAGGVGIAGNVNVGGTITAPTPAAGTNNTTVATTAFAVQAASDAAVALSIALG